MKELIAGYRRFMKERLPAEQSLFRDLAAGQKPHSLVIGCSDSRADPAMIFSARPGDLFLVRNIAAIVPPNEMSGYHGTSAAIAYAVLVLKVRTILVKGHARCGGVAAALAAGPKTERIPFVSDWVDLLAPAIARCPQHGNRQTVAEHESIKLSMERLLTFPFVAKAVAAGTLEIKGAHFDIADGSLSVLNETTGKFEKIQPERPAKKGWFRRRKS